MKLLPLALITLLAACATPTTKMEPCPETGCSSHTQTSANWPPYYRDVEALAVAQLRCPAEQLQYSRVGGAELVEGCGQQALYIRQCRESAPRECHPVRTTDPRVN
jgi:hypothetical protein